MAGQDSPQENFVDNGDWPEGEFVRRVRGSLERAGGSLVSVEHTEFWLTLVGGHHGHPMRVSLTIDHALWATTATGQGPYSAGDIARRMMRIRTPRVA